MNLRAHRRYANQRTERHPTPHPPGGGFVKMHRLRRRWLGLAQATGEIGRVESFRFIASPALEPRNDGADALAYMLSADHPLRRRGKSTFAEQWKLATVAAEIAGRLRDKGYRVIAIDEAQGLYEDQPIDAGRDEFYDRLKFDAMKKRFFGVPLVPVKADPAQADEPPADYIDITVPMAEYFKRHRGDES